MRYLFMMAPQIMRALHNIRRPQQRYCLLNGTAAAQAGQGFFIPGVRHKAQAAGPGSRAASSKLIFSRGLHTPFLIKTTCFAEDFGR